MATLQDIFNLAKADGGKFFVLDEKGEPKLVILGIDDYQKLLLDKAVSEAEKINEEIMEARLEEQQTPELPIQQPRVAPSQSSIDLREEVIDPSFDFEGPKVNLEDL